MLHTHTHSHTHIPHTPHTHIHPNYTHTHHTACELMIACELIMACLFIVSAQVMMLVYGTWTTDMPRSKEICKGTGGLYIHMNWNIHHRILVYMPQTYHYITIWPHTRTTTYSRTHIYIYICTQTRTTWTQHIYIITTSHTKTSLDAS